LLAGWYVTEIGRQPWVVYGLLRTSDAVSPNIVVAAKCCPRWAVYAAGVRVRVRRRHLVPAEAAAQGAGEAPPKDPEGGEKTPARPLSLPDENIEGARSNPVIHGAAYWLPVAWFGVIGFGVLMYVLLDGFVLGLGILAPFAEDEDQLDHMMNTAAPIWDGNETWLVLGGAGLLAAFPKAYALVLSALYLPVLMMLIALVFRGVAFEFRFKAERCEARWGMGIRLGSHVRGVLARRDPGRDRRGHAAAGGQRTSAALFVVQPVLDADRRCGADRLRPAGLRAG
jgi:hypothetical protein